MNTLRPYSKAIFAFIVAFVGSLVAASVVHSLGVHDILAALLVALGTTGGVYVAPKNTSGPSDPIT